MTRIRLNWAEYGCEALGLGLFMVSASVFAVLLFHPGSPVVALLPTAWVRRVLMGLAMGGTALVNIYSPWGRRSGSHLNPATTLAFYGLGKVGPVDLVGYGVAQLAGAVVGMVVASRLLGTRLADPAVNYVVTVPGVGGSAAAVVAEFGMTLVLLTVVLSLLVDPRWARWAGPAAATLVAIYIPLLAPVSGMSLNPARTVGSSVAAGVWTGWWIYLVAPTAGMGLAALLHLRRANGSHCAKIHHDARYRCVFCEWTARPGNQA